MPETSAEIIRQLAGAPTNTNETNPLVPTSRQVIRYDEFSNVELFAMMKERGVDISIRIPTFLASQMSQHLRQLCISTLRTIDGTKFGFCDLPAELRNRVYSDLLVLNTKGKCFPNILRTCKSIHSEATSILYGTNIVTTETDGYTVRIFGVKQRNLHHKDRWIAKWPAFLRRMHSIKFHCRRYDWSDMAPEYLEQDITLVFHSLCAFLEGNNRLKQLEIGFLHGTRPGEIVEGKTLLDFFSARLLAHPNFNLIVRNGPQPQPLVLDESSGILRNASSPAEARKIMVKLLKDLDNRVFKAILNKSGQRHSLGFDNAFVEKIRETLSVDTNELDGVPRQAHQYDRALLKFGELMWLSINCLELRSSASVKQRQKLLNFATEFRATLREGRIAAKELKAKEHELRAAARAEKAAQRLACVAAKKTKAAKASKAGEH